MAQVANLKPSRRRFLGSIQGKLILLLLVLLIPILLLQAYVFYDRFQTRRAEELQANLEIARAVANAFEAFVQDVLHQELAMGIAITSSQPMTPEDITRLLQQGQLGQSAIRDFSWVNRDGIFIYSSNPAMVGSDNRDRAYYRDIAGGREWTVGELVLARTTGKPVFGITRGIRDDQGTLLGVVVATVIPERLDAVVSFERSKGGGISIVDHKGMLVYRYPVINATWEERNWGNQYPEYEEVFKGKEVAKTFYAHYEGKNRIVGITPIIPIGWAAGAGRTEEVAMQAITSRLLPEAAIFLLVTLAAFCAALGLSRFICTPVKRLRDHALALGRGTMHELTPVSGPIEIKDLSDAFGMMAKEIRSREKEVVSLAEDAHKRAVEAEKSKKVIEAIMDAVPATIWLAHDPECNCITGNRPLYELLKMEPGTNLSRTLLEGERPVHFNTLSDGVEIPREELPLQMAAKGKEIKDYEFELLFDNGESRHVFGNAAPLISQEGEVYGSVAAFVDITERKRMEGELLKAKKLEALGILAGGIAHDFNNILTIVLGNIQIAEQGVERGTVTHQRLDNAAKAVIRAKDLATEFLTISFGGAPLKSVILLDGLIRDVTGLVLSGSHVDCEYSFPNDLWRVEVDYNLISRAFINIVLNAKEAMVQGGSITIHASNTVVDSKVNNIEIPKRDGRYVKISIIDRGIGIPKEDIDKIFDPYFSTKGRINIKGMGLGLAVAHSIIKRHQGHIHVESDAGFGTTFHIFLPASQTMEG